MLCGSAITAWKDGGSLWKAWNSRLMMVSLRVLCKQQVSMLHVFSYYAHTYAASIEEKGSFFATLQEIISSLPQKDCFMLLGDFNDPDKMMCGGIRGDRMSMEF